MAYRRGLCTLGYARRTFPRGKGGGRGNGVVEHLERAHLIILFTRKGSFEVAKGAH